ncbi:MAG TPA: FAD-dependent oxidoreductase, partial [Ramlibacter sp.]|uniref:FAD-dependent oxidoreductase n=1 Tax=Ramlibacter sp. TaxID=1917967 RepID=UPI002D7FB93B
MKIGIAGAGLLGRLLALQLARAGHEVHVFDPAPHPEARGAAGWTAAGMLSPVAELECADEGVFALGVRSLALWPQILAQLDVPVEFGREGSLLVAHRGDEGAARRVMDLLQEKVRALDPRLRGDDGVGRGNDGADGPWIQPLDPQQLRELEPALRGPAHAWFIPREGRIHTVQ